MAKPSHINKSVVGFSVRYASGAPTLDARLGISESTFRAVATESR